MKLSEDPDWIRSMVIIPVPKGYVLDLERVEGFARRIEPRFEIESVCQRGQSLLIEYLSLGLLSFSETDRFSQVLALEMMLGEYTLPCYRQLLLILRKKVLKPLFHS